MLEKLDNSLEAILFYNEDFDKVPLIACQRHYCCRFNLDKDNNFDKVNPDDIIHVRLLVWRNIFKKCKALQKNKGRVNASSIAS